MQDGGHFGERPPVKLPYVIPHIATCQPSAPENGVASRFDRLRVLTLTLLLGLLVVSCGDGIAGRSIPKVSAEAKNAVLVHQGRLLSLDPELAYELATSDEYLALHELYYKRLFWYRLSNARLDSVQLVEGRGPAEVQTAVDHSILPSGKMAVLDTHNAKVLLFSQEGDVSGFSYDEPNYLRFAQTDSSFLFVMGLPNDEFLGEIDFDGKTHDPYRTPPELRESLLSPYDRESRILVSGESVLVAPFIRPVIYVFGSASRSLEATLWYRAASPVVENEPAKDAETGVMVQLPPSSDMRVLAMAALPGSKTRVLLLIGRGDRKGDYVADRLYEFSLTEGEIIAEHPLGFIAKSIVSNSNNVFAIDRETNEVHSYSVRYDAN